MCGIAGIIGFTEQAALEDVARMNAILVHRGPDDSGEWLSPDGRVALASRRLAILDLSPAGHMPMSDGDGDGALTITYNGEIYNYIELRKELAAKGYIFRTGTDTEVILKAYKEWGEACLQRFNGMFAFALWDNRRRRLFAARDRFGEKPFYYHLSPDRFLFASEIKALLTDPCVSRKPDSRAVYRYIAFGHVDGEPDTFFAGIQQLPPAHYLTLDLAGQLSIQRYWDIDPEQQVRHSDRRDYAAEFYELFLDSVRIRLRSDVKVGTSLSGGLDSSSVVCAMNLLLGDTAAPIQNTFSARHREGPFDEGAYIDQVVAQANALAHHTWIEGEGLAEDVEQFLWHQDEPVAHTSQYAQWKVMELAQQQGITVLLDGQGADEMLAGYPSLSFGYRYAALLRKGRLMKLAKELRSYRRHHGSLGLALRYMIGPMLQGRAWIYAKKRLAGSSNLLQDGPSMRFDKTPDIQAPIPRFASPLKAALYRALTRTSLPSLLRYGDRSSMAFSREARLPFLDHRLVEYVLALPDDMLVDDGTTKVVLREATRNLIPEAVRMRQDKIGFATPESIWFRSSLQPWLGDRIQEAGERGIINGEAAETQWALVQQGRGNTGTVWRIANLEHWLQRVAGD